MMNLFNLYAKLTLDDSDYTVKINEAKKQSDNFTAKTISNGVKTVASWVGVTASIAVVVRTFKNLIHSTTEWAGSIKDLAQVYGMTYEQIQEVNYLAQESGKNAEWAIRKAQSSGQEYWEVLGLSNEEYREMIANAHEMGIILSDELVDGADQLGDAISQLKYQWQAVLAGLLAGDVNAEANLQKFFDRFFATVEKFTPAIIQFVVKLLLRLAVALVQYIPQLVGLLINEVINAIFSVNWLQVGIDIIKAIIQGVINGLGELLFGWIGDIFGFEIPKLDLGVGGGKLDVGSSYEITERTTQELTIRLESDGVTANDKAVVGGLENLIDEKLGKLLGGM